MGNNIRNRNMRELERANGNLLWAATHIFRVLFIFAQTADLSQENTQNITPTQHTPLGSEPKRTTQIDIDNDLDDDDNSDLDLSTFAEQVARIPERYSQQKDALIALLDLLKLGQDMIEALRTNM